MWRLCVLLCALCCVTGCATEKDKRQWAEFFKDLRGDNMKMRNNFDGP